MAAMNWLAAQLAWEHRLTELRAGVRAPITLAVREIREAEHPKAA